MEKDLDLLNDMLSPNFERNIERLSSKVGELDALRKVVVYKTRDHAEEDFRGTFHKWGLDLLEWPEGACSFTRGIVEDGGGKVHMVNPVLIKFMKEEKNEQS